jgi:cell division protease FtsH
VIKKLITWGALALLAVVVAAFVTAFFDRPVQISEPWQRRQLEQAVVARQVQKVALSPDRTQALATLQDGTRKRIDFQPNDRILDLLIQNKVDLVVQPQSELQSEQHLIGRLLWSLMWPLLVLGSLVGGLLFVLLRPQKA